MVCLQSADVGRAVRGAVAVVAVDLAVRSRSPSREPPLPREGRGSRSQGRDGLDPRGHQFHDASCRRRSMSTPSMSTPSTRRLHLNHCLIHCRYPPRSRRTRRRSPTPQRSPTQRNSPRSTRVPRPDGRASHQPLQHRRKACGLRDRQPEPSSARWWWIKRSTPAHQDLLVRG